VRLHWYVLIPEVAKPPLIRKGKVCIEFAILKDGKVEGMKWTQPSGDGSLDRAAWGGVASSSPFAPLPSEFRGKYLRLNFHFYYNPGEINIWPSGAVIYEGRFRIVRVAAGRSQKFSVGAPKRASKDSASAMMEKVMNDAPMNWTVVGSGCEGELCGTISSEGVYTAPILIPNPPSVAVTVALQSDPSKTDSVSVEIVEGSAH
jgi:TonB family protein